MPVTYVSGLFWHYRDLDKGFAVKRHKEAVREN